MPATAEANVINQPNFNQIAIFFPFVLNEMTKEAKTVSKLAR